MTMKNDRTEKQMGIRSVIEETIQNMRLENAAICEVSSGCYTYEVPPVPNHKLTAEECGAVRQAKDPVLEISLRTCWMYYDAIDATEQFLLQQCEGAVLEQYPDVDTAEISNEFHEMIEIQPPFSYYKQQVFG